MIIVLYSHSNNKHNCLHQHFIVYIVIDDNDRSLSKTHCESECAHNSDMQPTKDDDIDHCFC